MLFILRGCSEVCVSVCSDWFIFNLMLSDHQPDAPGWGIVDLAAAGLFSAWVLGRAHHHYSNLFICLNGWVGRLLHRLESGPRGGGPSVFTCTGEEPLLLGVLHWSAVTQNWLTCSSPLLSWILPPLRTTVKNDCPALRAKSTKNLQ